MPSYQKNIIIFLAGCLLFLPFLGGVHLFDWDEINFAECAREMILSKDYIRAQIDFMPFWEKPPVFIWMQVIAMKLFGVGDYAARFPNAVMGIVTLLTLFYAGKKVMNEKLATWWVIMYAATWLPHFYFKSGIIDPTFNYFIFLAFFQVHLLKYSGNKTLHAMLSGLFLGIAVLTKGPVAVLVAGLSFSIYLLLGRFSALRDRLMGGNLPAYRFTVKDISLIAVSAMIPFALWLGAAVAFYGVDYGKWFMTEFLTYQVRLFQTEDADHGGPFFYHFVVLLIGCFPAASFLFQYSRRRSHSSDAAYTKDFTRWMWIMFWVVLILFSIVKTKIVHYSSLCYFPLTYLAALQVYRLCYERAALKKRTRILLIVTACIWALLLIVLPVVGLNKQAIIPYIDDPFAVGNLSANISWSYIECLWGAGYIVAVIVAIVFMKRDFMKGIITLCAVQVVMIQVTILHFTPKIEGYSQRAAIEFFKGFEGKEVYIFPLGYKSYANLFYAKKPQFANKEYYKDGKVNEGWLLEGNVDRPTYFISKVQNADQYKKMPQLQCIGEKNGFVFFKRR